MLYEEIINILKDADYRTMTLKKVRLMIETKYNIHLNDRETEIYFLVMQYVKSNSAEQEREVKLNNGVVIDDTEDETELELDNEEIEEE